MNLRFSREMNNFNKIPESRLSRSSSSATTPTANSILAEGDESNKLTDTPRGKTKEKSVRTDRNAPVMNSDEYKGNKISAERKSSRKKKVRWKSPRRKGFSREPLLIRIGADQRNKIQVVQPGLLDKVSAESDSDERQKVMQILVEPKKAVKKPVTEIDVEPKKVKTKPPIPLKFSDGQESVLWSGDWGEAGVAVEQVNESNKEEMSLVSTSDQRSIKVEFDDHHHMIFLQKLHEAYILKKLKSLPLPPKPEYFGVLEIHGLRAWCRSDNWPMKVFMTVLLLIFVALLAWFIWLSLLSYFTNPLVTIYNAQFRSSLPFPNIYICLTNFVDKKKLEQHKVHEKWLNMYTALQTKFLGQDSLVENTHSLWDVIRVMMKGKQSVSKRDCKGGRKVKEVKQSAGSNLEEVKQYFMDVGFDLQDVFRECLFGVDVVDCSQIFETILDRNHGKCFSLDVTKKLLPRNMETINRLRLFIDIHSQSAYSHTNRTLFDGIYVFVQQKVSGAVTNKIFVKPGSEVQLKLRQKETNFINYKFQHQGQHCYDTEGRKENDFKVMAGSYDRLLCEMDCIQKVALRECSCLLVVDCSFVKSSIFSEYNNVAYCDEDDLTCCIYDYLSDIKLKKEIESCIGNCSSPCDRYHYYTFVSHLRLRPKAEESEDVRKKYESDYIILDISYLEWNKVIVKQRKSIDFNTFTSTLGGQFSLWFGMSLLTVVQAFIMIFMIIRFQIRSRLHHKRRSAEATHEEN